MPRPSRRTFRWRCWIDGKLRDVVVEPPSKEEKNVELGGVPGRLYEHVNGSLKTTPGVVHQDGDGRTYFVPNA